MTEDVKKPRISRDDDDDKDDAKMEDVAGDNVVDVALAIEASVDTAAASTSPPSGSVAVGDGYPAAFSLVSVKPATIADDAADREIVRRLHPIVFKVEPYQDTTSLCRDLRGVEELLQQNSSIASAPKEEIFHQLGTIYANARSRQAEKVQTVGDVATEFRNAAIEIRHAILHGRLDTIDAESGMMMYTERVADVQRPGNVGVVIVRRQDREFWEQCIELSEKNHPVCGVENPGIGKTTTTIYLLQRLINQNKPVVYTIRRNQRSVRPKDDIFYEFVPVMDDDGQKVKDVAVKVYKMLHEKVYQLPVLRDSANRTAVYVVDPGGFHGSCDVPGDLRCTQFIMNASNNEKHWGGSSIERLRQGVRLEHWLVPQPSERKAEKLIHGCLWTGRQLLVAKKYLKLNDLNEDKPTIVAHKKNIRHLEKRRTSTCAFADRIAHAALDVYRSKVVAIASSSSLEPTCIAAVLVHDATTDTLTVVSLGVGTKFLSQSVLLQDKQGPYGRRVRDLHAEVLCRRALRRFLCEAILADLRQEEGKKSSALSLSVFDLIQRTSATTTRQGEDNDHHCTWQWQLRDNCTWHAYFSSTPCGNATLKKFVTLRKETFREDLKYWPVEPHAQQPGHSVRLGQFSLLVKRDVSPEISTAAMTTAKDDDDDKNDDTTPRPFPTTHKPPQPAVKNTIPTGTAAVHTRQGSLHTCSDKVCRWNCLGWQGSLLASLLHEPLHVTSLTVGRKFSAPCLKRAICCRIAADHDKRENNNNSTTTTTTKSLQGRKKPRFTVHHPAVMCTAVYVDTDATIIPQNTNDRAKQDLQFRETRAFVWWPGLTRAHVLDGSTGLTFVVGGGKGKGAREEEEESPLCTKQLTKLFLDIQREINKHTGDHDKSIPQTLTELRQFKQSVSPIYETTKDQLLTSHKVMKEWVRRAAPADN